MIDHDGTRYTFAALVEMVDDGVEALAGAGVRAGDRVMVVAENCALFAVAVLAVNRLGAWIVPVNARHTAEEIDAILSHCGARLIVFAAEASQSAAAHAAQRSGRPTAGLAGGTLLASGPYEATPEPVEEDPQQRVALLIYTTGTTSAPKGVMLTNANLLWNAASSAGARGFRREDLVLLVLPLTHIFGFASAFLAALHVGAAMRFIARFDPATVLDALNEGVSVMPAVPNTYERLLTHLAGSGRSLSAPRLRYISAGGAPLDPDWKARTEATFGLTLNNGYGITEASPSVATTRPERPRADVCAGEPLPGVHVSVDAPNEEGIGELLLESPGVMRGYYRDPAATRAALTEEGAFRTGDLGKVDPDGSVWVVGRRKELIVRSGFNVYPPEIEAMLTREPDVLQAAVVGRPVKGNEEIVAFVLSAGVEPAELRERLRRTLAPYKVPQHIIPVDAFPTAPTGKILKHRLLQEFATKLPRPETSGPATPEERRLT